ncbi:MAG TPA: SRPBCC domain-containing protein [Terriglobales bacterium]|jgi:carbon monoxide dehydrogenase subunit G|nr:SRPBCC domain-containing protein [Terriglobales bacterium]
MTGPDEAIKFSGEFDVKANPENVFDFLTDPGRFAVLLKDPRDLTVRDAHHFTVKLRLGILFIKGTADVEMELAEAERPKRAIYKGNGVMARQAVTMVGGFELTPNADGDAVRTRVKWRAEIQFAGTASIAGDLLDPLGKNLIPKWIESLQRAIERQG